MFCLWGIILPNDLTLLEDNDARKSTSYSNILFLSDKGLLASTEAATKT